MTLRSVVWMSLVACGSRDAPGKQAPANDPWAQAGSGQPSAADPWAKPSPPSAPDPWEKSSPPAPAQPSAPAEPAPPPAATGALPAGRYPCWLSGMGNYTASVLGTFTFGEDGSYQSTAWPGGGTYRVDGARVELAGGKLDGWVGAVETPGGGTLRVRFRSDTPGDPGASIKVGDHVCVLKR